LKSVFLEIAWECKSKRLDFYSEEKWFSKQKWCMIRKSPCVCLGKTTCTILKRQADPDVSEVHVRMPGKQLDIFNMVERAIRLEDTRKCTSSLPVTLATTQPYKNNIKFSLCVSWGSAIKSARNIVCKADSLRGPQQGL
jgi:hypothetical protein